MITYLKGPKTRSFHWLKSSNAEERHDAISDAPMPGDAFIDSNAEERHDAIPDAPMSGEGDDRSLCWGFWLDQQNWPQWS